MIRPSTELPLVTDPARLVVLAVLGDDLDGLVLVRQDGRLDVVGLDLLHDIRRVLLCIRGAAVGIRKHDEEEQQHHKDRYEGPAEIALQIHRCTTPPARDGSLLISVVARRPPADLWCVPVTMPGLLLMPGCGTGILDGTPRPGRD